LRLLPEQDKFEESDTPYLKIMHILDFMSGMTDLYALELYKNTQGISLPSF
jgi:dGTPase